MQDTFLVILITIGILALIILRILKARKDSDLLVDSCGYTLYIHPYRRVNQIWNIPQLHLKTAILDSSDQIGEHMEQRTCGKTFLHPHIPQYQAHNHVCHSIKHQ